MRFQEGICVLGAWCLICQDLVSCYFYFVVLPLGPDFLRVLCYILVFCALICWCICLSCVLRVWWNNSQCVWVCLLFCCSMLWARYALSLLCFTDKCPVIDRNWCRAQEGLLSPQTFTWRCIVWVEVFCWIDRVWSSNECASCACDPSVHLSVPSIGFVCVMYVGSYLLI